MKKWLKHGLIAISIYILLIILGIIGVFTSSNEWAGLGLIIFIWPWYLFIGNNYELLEGANILMFVGLNIIIIFGVGAIIGLIIQRKKAKNLLLKSVPKEQTLKNKQDVHITMESKAPFIWILIGVILGFLGAFGNIIQYFLFKSTDIGGLFGIFGDIIGNVVIWNLISGIIGIIISIILIFCLVKIKKIPSKNNFIIITVLGGLGMFLGMGLGGILVLIGGIVGIVKSNKSPKQLTQNIPQ